MANKGTSAIKWLLATGGGAVVGVLAIRALDKYVLKKEEKEPKALEPSQQMQQQQPQQGLYQPGFGPQVMPVFLPFPTSYSAPLPPSLPAPSNAPPSPDEAKDADEEDIVDVIEREWDE